MRVGRARFGLALVLLAAASLALPMACSGSSEASGPPSHSDAGKADSPADAPGTDGCFPRSCVSAGAQCGQIEDGCGSPLDCGACPGGQLCGGGGPNKCGSGPCFPKTCADYPSQCGLLSDACSSVINCNTNCKAPQTCGGGGVAGQCGCAPSTCKSLGVACGQASDGCGANLDCGTCTTPPVCGNGACESGENGSSCGQDCCDAMTSCSQTKQNQGTLYCRQINGGSYGWYTEAQGIAFCDEPSEVCVATYSCGGQSGTCAGIPGKWVTGPCPVCGDGACDWPEDGTSCPQDCCDAATPCSETKQDQGVLYCRQINGGAYQWYTEAQGISYCDEPSEICTSTFACGGQSGTCKTIPGGWVFGPC